LAEKEKERLTLYHWVNTIYPEQTLKPEIKRLFFGNPSFLSIEPLNSQRLFFGNLNYNVKKKEWFQNKVLSTPLYIKRKTDDEK